MTRTCRQITALTTAVLLTACAFVRSADAPGKSLEAVTKRIDETIAKGPYKAEWESLKAHEEPEWFRDAKLGIYTHWGPITIATEPAPALMEWYAREMYEPSSAAFKYHQSRFGDQKKVGYKDVIPSFEAEKFNADEWAELFAQAGARFAGPVAIHHDHYANWDSEITRWNSRAVGPKRDLTGELEKALRKRGLKLITTFHHGFAWRYYEPAYAYDAGDPQWTDLYAEPHGPQDPPSRRFLDTWVALVDEVLHKYRPDLIWFDFELGSVIPPEYQRRMFADAYNWAAASGREIGVAHKHREIHQHTGILDFERGREDRLTPYPWLTDTSVGPWFHHDVAQFKSVDELVDIFVDIVSKNGCMLLNVGPRADGTIPAKGKEILLGLGGWLKVNGEAIYGTRPWLVFGEGPTQMKGGAFSEETDRKGYAAGDLRFTRSRDGHALHVIALDWPDRELVVNSMKVDGAAPDARVELLGAGRIEHAVNAEKHLVLKVPALAPEQRPCDHAFTFRLTGFRISLHESVLFSQPDAIRLEPEKATLEGTQVRTQVNEGRPNIGFWDVASERVHWLVRIPRPGSYAVRVELSSAYGSSGLKLTAGEQLLSVEVPKTDGWFKPVLVPFGRVQFGKAGVYHLVLEPADPPHWRAVNVYGVQMALVE
jgi:alpha-L-fucosidase